MKWNGKELQKRCNVSPASASGRPRPTNGDPLHRLCPPLASVGPGLLRATPVEWTRVETVVRGSYRGEFRLHLGVDTHQNCHYGDRKPQADQTRYNLVLHRQPPHPECPKLMGSLIVASSRKQKGHIVVRCQRD